ncbi:MAG: hypothetical protein ACSHX9_04755 [Luteolibacter sp.]
MQDNAPNPLVEAASSHLTGNAEQHLTAISVISETADPDHPLAAETIARWEAVDRKKYPFLWKTALYLIALAALIAVIVSQRHEVQFVTDLNNVSLFSPPDLPLPKGLSEKEKLLLGDPSLDYYEDHQTAEALYLSEPDNPAYFAEYVQKYSFDFDELPPDLLDTAVRIDPQNSFYLYFAVGHMGDDTIVLEPLSGSSPKPRIVKGVRLSPAPVERQYKINDQAVYEKSLELIEKASELSGFQSYATTMMRERMRCFRNTATTVDRATALIFVYAQTSSSISLLKVSDTLSARAQELSNDGDEEGFLKLVNIRQHYIEALLSNPDVFLINELVNRVVVANTAQYFHHAAKRLGLPELEKKFGDEHQAMSDMADRKRLRSAYYHDWVTEKSSLLGGFTYPMIMRIVDSPPPITLADLAPQRYADHALAIRVGLIAIALSLLIFALPIFLFRFVFPASLRKTAARLIQLLRPIDWILAIVLGVILPLAAILLLNRFTELGGREWALGHYVFLFPSVHLVAILLWVSLAPAAVIRWRLLRRIKALGLPGIPAITAAPALLGVSVLAIGAYPVVMKFELDTLVLIGLAAPVAFWLSVVFGNALHGLIGKAQHRITLAATSMAILPCLSFAIIAVIALLPVYKASEIHWLAQDAHYSIKPDAPDLGLYEFRVAAQKRKEIREALGMES